MHVFLFNQKSSIWIIILQFYYDINNVLQNEFVRVSPLPVIFIQTSLFGKVSFAYKLLAYNVNCRHLSRPHFVCTWKLLRWRWILLCAKSCKQFLCVRKQNVNKRDVGNRHCIGNQFVGKRGLPVYSLSVAIFWCFYSENFVDSLTYLTHVFLFWRSFIP